MRSSEFRCPEHISPRKAHELKANFRDFPCFVPVFWKVTKREMGGDRIYGIYIRRAYNRKRCLRAGWHLFPGTVTKVLETVRRSGYRREAVLARLSLAEPERLANKRRNTATSAANNHLRTVLTPGAAKEEAHSRMVKSSAGGCSLRDLREKLRWTLINQSM